MSSFNSNITGYSNLNNVVNEPFINYNDVPGDLPGIPEFDQDIDMHFRVQLPDSNTQIPNHAYPSVSNRLPQAISNPSEFISQAAPSPLIPDKSSILVSLDMDISYNHKKQVVLEKGSWAPENGWSARASDYVDTGAAIASDAAGTKHLDTTPTGASPFPPAPLSKSRRKSKTKDDELNQCSKCPQTSNRKYNTRSHELTLCPLSGPSLNHQIHSLPPTTCRETGQGHEYNDSMMTHGVIGSNTDGMLLDLPRPL